MIAKDCFSGDWDISEFTYLKVWADYESTGIHDRFGNVMYARNSPLSNELWLELSDWVNAYNSIIYIPEHEKTNYNALSKLMDQHGLKLASRVRESLKGLINVYYYSDGLGKYLDIDNGNIVEDPSISIRF